MNQAEINVRDESAISKNAGFGQVEVKTSGGCCCGVGGSAPTVISRRREEKTVTNTEPEIKTTTTTLTAPEIVCGGCAGSIKKALGNVAGVSAVEVDVATKKVTVNHDPNVSGETIVDALDRAGYSVES